MEALLGLATTDDELDDTLKQIKSRSVIVHALNESLEDLTEDDRQKLLKIANDLKIKADSLNLDNIVINEETDTILKSVSPKEGRMIKFQSIIPHLGRPPVRDAHPRRYSLVFQTHPTDSFSLGDIL